MTVQEALEFVDDLVYKSTGKHLNDLERAVFMGSWQGQTYEEIYPLNPQYVEKYIGYKLWQKLSGVLGEKVTKKNFRGALERSRKQQQTPQTTSLLPLAYLERELDAGTQRVFISHRNQEPDLSVATQLYKAINAAGHQALMADMGAIPAWSPEAGEDWFEQIDAGLKQCDYLVLLLSPQAATSEMVIEELQQVKALQASRGDRRPMILPIRINGLSTVLLNHDLRNYLQETHPFDWQSAADTTKIMQQVLRLIHRNGELEVAEPSGNHSDDLPTGPLNLESSTLLTPPSPVAEPELPQGQVRLASAFYVERLPYEAQCYKEILQPGTLIRIKAPRQMGKTSLMSRILYQAREQGCRTVPLSFQHADQTIFTSLDQLLQWVCTRVTRKLRLPDSVETYWTDTYGSKDNCTAYFEDRLLSAVDSPLVLGLDEVDRVFQYPKIADDFFGLLRAWYEEAGYGDSDSGLWEKLRLVVVHSTEVYIPLDVNQSPFNVGLPIELSEFSAEQVSDLAQRHGLDWQAAQVEQLMKMIGGHPYLVRVALYHIAQQQISLTELLETGAQESGIYGDHLRRHWWNLKQHSELATAFSQVVSVDQPVELESVLAFKLHSLGLVQLRGNQVTPRLELYRQYFRDRFSLAMK